MLKGIAKALFGTRHDRELKRVQPILDEIHQHEERLASLADDEVQAQTQKFRAILKERTEELERRIAELKEKKRVTSDAAEREQIDNELTGPDGLGGLERELRELITDSLEEILPEVFATVREACRRLLGTKLTVTGHELDWNMVPYDVQLIGGVQLHRGRIAEMATGEGKTLVATLPLSQCAPGQGRAPRTVNSTSPAATRSGWGMCTHGSASPSAASMTRSRGRKLVARVFVRNHLRHEQRVRFDYLRDNMVVSLDNACSAASLRNRRRVDSVLIDEARRRSIISGPLGTRAIAITRNTTEWSRARASRRSCQPSRGEAERALKR